MRTIPRPPAFASLFVAFTTFAAAAESARAQANCTSKDGTGTLEGTVLDRETSIPLQSAEVTVRWFPSGRSRAESLEAHTDRAGRYRVCNVPLQMNLTVQARFYGEGGESKPTVLRDANVVTLPLTVQATYSTVMGRVVEASGNKPIGSASVTLGSHVAAQITRPDGTFRFERIPPGVYPLGVEHVAYTELDDSLDVQALSSINATIRMAPNVIPIDPIEVSVRVHALERVGFYTRKDRSPGTFITRRQIEAMMPHIGSDVLRRVAGVRLERGRFGNVAIGRGGCPFRFIMDGARIGPSFSMDDVLPNSIEAIEVYMGASEVPIEFQGFASDASGTCGVIVIWTRHRA